MRSYHLLFHDPFVNYKPYIEFISNCFNLISIDIGHLFGEIAFVKNPEISKQIEKGELSFFSVFMNIILSNLKSNNLLIPAYPRFLDDKSEYDLLTSTLASKNFKLSVIWYVQNVNLEKTISESLKMKGYKGTNDYMFNNAFDNAKRNKQSTKALINSIQHDRKYILSSDTMMDILPETKQEINKLASNQQ